MHFDPSKRSSALGRLVWVLFRLVSQLLIGLLVPFDFHPSTCCDAVIPARVVSRARLVMPIRCWLSSFLACSFARL